MNMKNLNEMNVKNVKNVKGVGSMKNEIRNLSELKNVKEVAKFVFDRVVDGKLFWAYGQYDEYSDGFFNENELGIIVNLENGDVFATAKYDEYRNNKNDLKGNSIFNITDAVFCNLQLLDRERYTAEDVELAIKKSVAELRARFFTQVD